MPYIHEQPGWPRFTWSSEALAGALAAVRHKQGKLLGRMEGLGFELRDEASLAVLTSDVVKSSAIEGETLDAGEVRSSIAGRLGLDAAGLPKAGREVEGIVEMMLDATQRFEDPLTRERLLGWHGALFPAGRNAGGGGGLHRMGVGAWRTDERGPMRVVSGPLGRERVHFEAPAAARLEGEMARFLEWFNGAAGAGEEESLPQRTQRARSGEGKGPGNAGDQSDQLHGARVGLDPVLKSGVAHLWFVTIHPFEDGNGRVARAIADMLLARADGTARRFYSMSSQIEREREEYYLRLEGVQRGELDITRWLEWYLGCLDRAVDGAAASLGSVLRKGALWQWINRRPVNERQRLVINLMLDGRMLEEGFKGHMNTSKYAVLAKCSADTALRDIQELVERGVLVKNEGRGRSTSYRLLVVE